MSLNWNAKDIIRAQDNYWMLTVAWLESVGPDPVHLRLIVIVKCTESDAQERMTGGKELWQSGHSIESCSCCSITHLHIIWTFKII